MMTTIRQVMPESKITHQVSLPMIESVISRQTVEQVLSDCDAWEQREKKLSMSAIVYWLIGLSLFPQCSMREVWRRLVDGWKAIWPPEQYPLLRAHLLAQVCEERVPPRRSRFQARVVKRARSKYLRKWYADLHAPCFHRPFLDIVTLI